MKVKIRKRLVSLLISLSFAMTLLPQMAFAQTDGSDYILNRDFTNGVSDIAAMNTGSGTSDGLVTIGTSSGRATDENGYLKMELKDKSYASGGIDYTASLFFAKSGRSGATISEPYLNLSGNIVLESEMAFDTVEDITYYPLAIVPDTLAGGKHYYNFTTNMIKIADGRCYINNTDVGEIKKDTYYTYKIQVNIDGDSTTTDTFTASVTDGTNTYTGSGDIGVVNNTSITDGGKLTGIAYVNVIKRNPPASGHTASQDATVYASIKNIRIYTLVAPVVTASIEDGETDVQEGSDITLTFDQEMDTTTFSKITLLDNEENTVTGLTVTPTSETTCVVTLPKALRSFESYKLVIPGTVSTPQGIGTKATVITFTAGESIYVIPDVTFDIEDGAVNIKEGSSITVSFDQDMDPETYNNIILQDGAGDTVAGLTVTSIDERSCVVTLPAYLKSLSEYTLIVPGTVQSLLEVGVADESVSFTSAKSNTLLSRDFTSGVSADELTAMKSSAGTSDGLVTMTSSVIPEDGTDCLKLTMRQVSDPSFAPSFFFGKGGMTGRKFNESLALQGIVILEAEMMFETVEGMEYYPLSIVNGDEAQVQKGSYMYNFARNTIRIQDGRCYIDNKDVGEIKPNTYYTFKLDMQIDGDASTENDPFIATVSDGTNTYTGSGKLYVTNAETCYKFTDIGFVNVLRMMPKTGADDVNAYIKTLKFYQEDVTTVSANIEDGNKNENIDINQDIVLTFSKPVEAVELRFINLYKANGETVKIKVEPLTGMTDRCTVTVPGGLENNRVYKLSVPAVADELQYKSAAREITFITKPKDAPVTVSAITVNDGGALNLVGGATVKASVNVANKTDKAQDASLIICVYNSENRMKQLSFSKQSLAVNATDIKLESTVTVPTDIGENAYIRVFVADSFENMNALSDMIILE